MELKAERSIETRSLAPAVINWLANASHARILHVFDRSCNLIDESGEILSVVDPQIGNGPFNLVLETELRFSDYLDSESGVSIQGDRLSIGDLTIRTGAAKLWNPSPDWRTLHASREHIVSRLNQLQIPYDLNFPLPVWPMSNLPKALAAADLSTARLTSSKLAGLGIGLTPSGDDFLMGAVHAVWIIHPRNVAGELGGVIATVAAPLTTSLSAAWLRCASKGEAGELWHRFFDALAGRIGDPRRVMEKILAVGETSGADALVGFVSTLTAWTEVPVRHG